MLPTDEIHTLFPKNYDKITNADTHVWKLKFLEFLEKTIAQEYRHKFLISYNNIKYLFNRDVHNKNQ